MIWRRFNQAALIARLLAKWQRSVCISALRRVEDRLPQVHVPRSKRAENVRGVFAAKRVARHLAGHSICIVDDLTTTGSTIREAARVLSEFNPERIYTAVIAVAEHDDTEDMDLETL